MPLVRALTLLGEHSESPALRYALAIVTKDVASGSALHKALERHPKCFDTLWISLVQAGELSGQLPKALKQVGSYLQAQEELKGKVITALAYPAVLFCISMSVLVFFIVKIVPTFADIFKSFDIKLPLITQTIIMISNVFVHQFPMLLLGLVAFVVLLKAYLATEAGQYGKAKFMFGIPFFGPFIKNIQVERLLTTLSTLIESGVSILNAISVLEGVFATNRIFSQALKTVKNDVATGKSISAAFKKTGVFPSLVTEMMWMGEESGSSRHPGHALDLLPRADRPVHAAIYLHHRPHHGGFHRRHRRGHRALHLHADLPALADRERGIKTGGSHS